MSHGDPKSHYAPGSLLPTDTKTLIKHRGLPDFQVDAGSADDDDRLLLYRHEIDTGLTADEIYYLGDDGNITHKITELDRNDAPGDEESWVQDTMDDVRGTLRDLKRRRTEWNETVGGLPGFNYFDRVDVFSRTMKLGLDHGSGGSLTTLSVQPDEQAVNLTFKVPIY